MRFYEVLIRFHWYVRFFLISITIVIVGFLFTCVAGLNSETQRIYLRRYFSGSLCGLLLQRPIPLSGRIPSVALGLLLRSFGNRFCLSLRSLLTLALLRNPLLLCFSGKSLSFSRRLSYLTTVLRRSIP